MDFSQFNTCCFQLLNLIKPLTTKPFVEMNEKVKISQCEVRAVRKVLKTFPLELMNVLCCEAYCRERERFLTPYPTSSVLNCAFQSVSQHASDLIVVPGSIKSTRRTPFWSEKTVAGPRIFRVYWVCLNFLAFGELY